MSFTIDKIRYISFYGRKTTLVLCGFLGQQIFESKLFQFYKRPEFVPHRAIMNIGLSHDFV